MHSVLKTILHAVSGVFAGACFCIAVVDMPYLRGLQDDPSAVKAFAQLLTNMGRFMLPQLIIILSLGVYFGVCCYRNGTLRSALPALTVLTMIILITFIVHIPINIHAMKENIPQQLLQSNIAKWQFWHLPRTVLALSLPALWIRCFRGKATHS